MNPGRLLLRLTALLAFSVFLPAMAPLSHAAEGGVHHGTAEAGQMNAKGMPWLGVVVKEIDEDTAKAMGLDDSRGVIVMNVLEGSPAEAAGLLAGDMIIEADGVEIRGYDDLFSWLKKYKIGSRINLLVDKQGKLENIYVSLSERPGRPEALYPDVIQGCPGCPHGQDLLHGLHEMKEGRNYGIMLKNAVKEMNLSGEQKKKALSVLSEFEKKNVRLSGDMKIGAIELRELLDERPVNLEKARTKINEIGYKRSELLFLRIRTLEEIRKMLGEDQRKMLEEMMPLSLGHGVLIYPEIEDQMEALE